MADFDKRVHFIGIGGIGMSAIASILQAKGYEVSGSDLKDSPITRKLSAKGIKVFTGHQPSSLGDICTVVYSSAIKEANPELAAARERGLTVLKRAEALAKLMREKTCIAVSGAHGKTTTSALIGHLLLEAGFHPTVAVGGVLKNLDDNSCLGSSDFFVAEADESDGTFLCYNPDYPVVTNIDREHLDFYQNWDKIIDGYTRFIHNTKPGGCLFACCDDPAVMKISEGYKGRVTCFGLSQDGGFSASDIVLDEFSSRFSYSYKGRVLGRAVLPLAGRHNISNSLAVIALGYELGIPAPKVEEALASFKGTERRFQLKADILGVKIIDDYGHHPAEIRATIAASRNVSHKRLIVVFQPHRYSRTKFLLEDFVDCFGAADSLVLTDIYAASERPIEGISSEYLCARIRAKYPGLKADYCRKEDLVSYILDRARPGDLVLTLGAGDIGKISDELVFGIKGTRILR